MASPSESSSLPRKRVNMLASSSLKRIGTRELIAAFKDVSGGGGLILTSKAGNLARRLVSLKLLDMPIGTCAGLAGSHRDDISHKKESIPLEGAASVTRHTECQQGLAPSLKEIDELKTVTGEYCDMSTFATFCKEVAHGGDSPELLAELFGCYDPENTGKVPLRVARNIMQNCGEALSQEEMNAVLAELGSSGEEIDYSVFCARNLLHWAIETGLQY